MTSNIRSGKARINTRINAAGLKIFLIAFLGFVYFNLAWAQGKQVAPSPLPISPGELAEPNISISPDQFYPLEEILYIEGRANPNAIVSVYLQKQGDKPLKFTVKADSAGEWVVAEKTYLGSGDWEVRARQQIGIDISGWSNPRIIRSVVTGVNIFGLNVRYVVISVIVLAALLLIAFVLVYSVKKVQKAKRLALERSMKDAELRLHRGISEIRKDLIDKEKREHVLRELEELEKGFDDDIEGIEKKQ